MQKFNLNQYKTSNPYFTLFDVYFRDINANKETLLKEMGIAPSSYRKCRRGELHISEKSKFHYIFILNRVQKK